MTNDENGARLSLPSPVRSAIDRLVQKLEGETALVSVVLYGSAARGDYVADQSDVNVLLVFESLDLGTLDRLMPISRTARRDGEVAVWAMTRDDLTSSADVFPIKFLDMQRHHVILRGEDVLEGLEIDRRHLRLRTEQEIKNLLFRLRRFYLERADRPELLQDSLIHAVGALRADLRSLLIVRRGDAPLDPRELLTRAAIELDVPEATLTELLALRDERRALETSEVRRLYASLLETVARAAHVIDRDEG